MKYVEAMICFNPPGWPGEASGQIEVGPWPDRIGWSRKYRFSLGACFANRRKEMDDAQRFTTMLCELQNAVVMHKVDPSAAHREFSKIDEYRAVFIEGVWG